MKVPRLAAIAVLLAPIPFAGAAEPVGAAQVHAVFAHGHLRVYECCSFLSPSHTVIVDFSKHLVLTHARPTEHFWVKGCAGDQARGELRVDLRLTESEEVVTKARLKLYEGSTCDNLDLDGADSRSTVTGEGQSRRLLFEVWNDEFHSNDTATADFTVGQNPGAPPEPSNLVAGRVPGNSGKISLDWVDQATDETGYEILNTSTGQIARLAPDSSHTFWYQPIVYRTCFQVRAVNAQGSSSWTPVSPTAECV
ncbi:hypothetical protein GT039_06535 [Streptomyces sp. SID2955]|nr:hypothetical protein [Streptomyces sp. SID2955]